jgi:hypothetical protein
MPIDPSATKELLSAVRQLLGSLGEQVSATPGLGRADLASALIHRPTGRTGAQSALGAL